MLRKLKQKGESSILHWMLRKASLIRSFTIRDLKEVREHGERKSISVRGSSKCKGPV